MRKVCVVIGSRANYASIKSVMLAARSHPDLQLQVVVGASALLDRFGSAVDIVEADGFRVDARVHMIIEGETPVTMAKSTGLGLLELPTVFETLAPDVVVSVGDRFETMATAIAATYTNIPLAHTMGGEVSGTIDESVRHAVTKLAHIHFPANRGAAERILRMGEDPAAVHVVGCPRLDLIELTKHDLSIDEKVREWIASEGVGATIDIEKPFLLMAQYPVTTEFGQGKQQVVETLEAIRLLGMPAVVLWPNADAGAEEVASGLRQFRESQRASAMGFYKNFPPEIFLRLMARTACMVGNSSAAIREGAFLGTPAVNVGTRQAGRERGQNVIDVPHERQPIIEALRRQIQHGRHQRDPLYGDGRAGERIADVLAKADLQLQKRMTY